MTPPSTGCWSTHTGTVGAAAGGERPTAELPEQIVDAIHRALAGLSVSQRGVVVFRHLLDRRPTLP